jgi:lipopolysaccharide transport system permease protein
MLRHIWEYRQFIFSCVKRDFLSKYKGSILGLVWSVLQPLALIIIYTVVFSEIMRNKLAGMENVTFAYSLYLCSGILTWNLFQETLTSSVNVFLQNSNLMKKVSFPRICLPVITMCSAFLNFMIGFSLFLLFLVIISAFPIESFLSVLVVLFVQIAFSLTLGIGLGVLNVFFRDVGQFLNVILQFWFWFTPVVYPINIVPKYFQTLLTINPMFSVIKSYQNIFVYNTWPEWQGLGIVFLISLIMGYWALHIYRKHVGEMVDEL